MVAHAAGRLSAKKLVSLWGIPDLRFIEVSRGLNRHWRVHHVLAICVFTQPSPQTSHSSPRLQVGSDAIANQSRATIGGNLVNGSPAADSSPALLVYDAEIELISVHGKRRVPYAEFHTGYKHNVPRPG